MGDLPEPLRDVDSSCWEKTSEKDGRYNCVAWAVEDQSRNIWPIPVGLGHQSWPRELEQRISLETFRKLFEMYGYELCEDTEHENGTEKIAIYKDENGKPTHVTRQLTSGEWSSKIGRGIDISHGRHDLLEGVHYGSVALIMKRKKGTGTSSVPMRLLRT